MSSSEQDQFGIKHCECFLETREKDGDLVTIEAAERCGWAVSGAHHRLSARDPGAPGRAVASGARKAAGRDPRDMQREGGSEREVRSLQVSPEARGRDRPGLAQPSD